METSVKPLPGMVIIANDNIDMAFVYEEGIGFKEGINYKEATKEQAEEFFRINPSMKEKAAALTEDRSPKTQTENLSNETHLKEPTLTFGQKAVGISFNPGGNPQVDRVKQHYANIIDMMNEKRNSVDATPEQKRLYSVAITEAQTAQMWAVKALTWKD